MVGLLQYVAGAATGTEAVKLLGYELATDNKLHAFLIFLSSLVSYAHRGDVKIMVRTPFQLLSLFTNVCTVLPHQWQLVMSI